MEISINNLTKQHKGGYELRVVADSFMKEKDHV